MTTPFAWIQRLAIGLAGLSIGALPAGAAPDVEGTCQVTEPQFGLYTATKSYKVYSATNPENPLPLAGNYTYTYTITNQPNSIEPPVCLVGFDMEAPLGSITAAGYIPGAGVDPSSVQVGTSGSNAVVEWNFAEPSNDICPGAVSDELTLQSPYGPGAVTDNVSSLDGTSGFDAPGSCVGPFVAPTGEPLPCTIGFWKNRADGKPGTLQWFPNGDFDLVVSQAVTLSSGIFASSTELLAYLGSTGKRPIGDRAKQQLAATLLNMAAADLYPDNQKCKLFDANPIVSNACGDSITIATAVNAAKVDVNGDTAAQHEAMECLDDINNGVGIDD